MLQNGNQNTLVATRSCCHSAESCDLLEADAATAPVDNTLAGFFSHLTDTTSYPARWNCGAWTPIEGWLHIFSDIGIFLAYLAIPITIVFFLWKRCDFRMHGVLFLFAAFILFCGTGHLLEAVIFYYPIYRIAGLLKLFTALVSWGTVLALIKMMPKLLELPSLVTRNELLEKAAKSKGEFLANMSHEIRTPMTAILGYADLLSNESNDLKDRQDAVRTIQQNGQHLLAIINDILDMSKIDAGSVKVERLNTDTVQLTQEIVDLLARRAEGKGIRLEVQYEQDTPVSFETDPTRIRQILLNLVGNAIKFTEVGGITIKVSYSSEANGKDEMRFRVEDTGIGMTPAQLAIVRKFEPFVQADGSTTRCYGGTGLGLKISQSLAKLLGGSIAIESEANQGSAFTLTLKANSSSIQTIDPSALPKEAPPILVPKSDSNGTRALEGKRLLLVEDGLDNQRLISFILKRAGAQVDLADNGKLGIEQVLEGQNHFDLILMDMQMPVLDGYNATSELRQAGIRLPIIALTAHAMPEDRQRCLDAGCIDYLSKPIDPDGLISICQRYLSATKQEEKLLEL